MNLQTVAKLAENTVDQESLPVVESHIDRFGSVLRNAIIRAYGMLTSAAKDLKDKIIRNLKETAKDFKSKLKDKFIDAFNKAAEFLFRILNGFASKIFSFVDMIKKLGMTKGYGLKSVNISFDPPKFDSFKILGFSVPIPKVSLPKVEVDFEMSSETSSADTNNQMNNFREKLYNNSTKNSTTIADLIEQLKYKYNEIATMKQVSFQNPTNMPHPKGIATGFELPGTTPQYPPSLPFKIDYMSGSEVF
jgi:hypothetical protein